MNVIPAKSVEDPVIDVWLETRGETDHDDTWSQNESDHDDIYSNATNVSSLGEV